MRLILVLCAAAILALSCSGRNQVEVRPKQIDDVLVNPGIGFETFHCFNGDKEVKNYPECSIAYFRFYWNVLEPEEGKYNFALIDSLLVLCRERGQDLALRFMPMDTEPKAPKWFIKKAKGYWFTARPGGGGRPIQMGGPPKEIKGQKTWGPDFRAFGQRYNGHPDIIRMDIGSVGRWGEWHTSRTPVPMITEENAYKVIDWYFKYWGKTPLSMLIGYVPGLRHAVKKGAGWRADSLGDWGHFSETWCHMINLYPKNLAAADALDAWKRGPVTFEPPGTMEHLELYVPSKGGGYDNMWNQALKWGASSFNAKSRPIPDSQVPSIKRFLKRCGYRFVLRSLVHDRKAAAGKKLHVHLAFENIGVAPPYKNYVLAVRLSKGDKEIILDTDAELKTWLPGTHEVDQSFKLDPALEPGKYDLSVGILDPYYRDPEVKLAIEGRGDDGWYKLSQVEVG